MLCYNCVACHCIISVFKALQHYLDTLFNATGLLIAMLITLQLTAKYRVHAVEPRLTDTHDITDNSESHDCHSIHFSKATPE